MSISTQCPNCNKKFNAPDQLLGKSVKCPQCQNQFTVQPASAPPPSEFALAPAPSAGEPAPEKSGKRSLLVGLLAGVAGMVILCGCGLTSLLWFFAGSTASWKEFNSKDGGFSVTMPANPVQKSVADPKIFGANKIFEVAGEQSRSRNFTVQYYDLPDRPINEYIYFTYMRNHLLAGGGKLARENELTLSTYPGKEVIINVTDDQVLLRRIYLAEARVFWVTAQVPKASVDGSDVHTFFDSFKITAVPKAAERPTVPAVVASVPDPPKPPVNPVVPNTPDSPKIKPPPNATPPSDFPINPDENTLVELINRFRQGEKVAALKPAKELFDGARVEADLMAQKKGRVPNDYGYLNVFRLTMPTQGATTPQQLIDQMLSTKVFRAQLADDDLHSIGIGIAKGNDGTVYYMFLLCGKKQ